MHVQVVEPVDGVAEAQRLVRADNELARVFAEVEDVVPQEGGQGEEEGVLRLTGGKK